MTNRCIVCNAAIPEGRQVCPMCEETVVGKMINERQKIKAVKEAVETIASYCKARETCEGCCFFDAATEMCSFALLDLPCDWSLPK